MKSLGLLAIVILLNFNGLETRGVIWDSPCPKYFQYGFLDSEPIGLLDVPLPVESLNTFNVTLEFLPKTASFKNAQLAPRIELLNEFAPVEIVRDTKLGLATRFVVHFTREAPLFNYKLVNVLLNDELMCRSEDGECKIH